MSDELTEMVFDGTYDGYLRIYEWMRDVGNTYQQAGNVIFHGGSPAIMRVPGMCADVARPGDFVVMHSQHDFRVKRGETIEITDLSARLAASEAENERKDKALALWRDNVSDRDPWGKCWWCGSPRVSTLTGGIDGHYEPCPSHAALAALSLPPVADERTEG